jgi:hypothetical protein
LPATRPTTKRCTDGSGFAYFDTRAGAGITLEIRKTAAPT